MEAAFLFAGVSVSHVRRLIAAKAAISTVSKGKVGAASTSILESHRPIKQFRPAMSQSPGQFRPANLPE